MAGAPGERRDNTVLGHTLDRHFFVLNIMPDRGRPNISTFKVFLGENSDLDKFSFIGSQ